MNAKKVIIFIMGMSAVFLFIFMIKEKTPTKIIDSNKMRVTASFYPLAFLAEEIGGDKVSVLNLTLAGAEPHDFEPSARDMAEMEQSKVVIVNGLGLEPWIKNAQKNIDPQKTELLIVGDKLFGKTDTKDPHVWLSLLFMSMMAEITEQTFAKTDPKNESYYISNLQTLKTKLNELNQEYQTGLANCAQKEIITSHSAFHYLAEDYGLTQMPIAGLSPDAEPSPKTLGDIVVFAKKQNVKYIFFESLASPKLSQTIASEIGAKTLILNPIEGLTNKDRSEGKNYLSIMRENLVNLQTALSCK